MAEQHVDEQRTPLKRRGILTAAAVVVAGIAAKQTAQPVLAAAPMQFADTTASYTNTAMGPTVIIDHTGYTDTNSVFTAQTLATSAKCALQGVSGLRGSAPFQCGVFGDVGTASSIGVFGNANSGAPSIGVFGRSESDGIGVKGQSNTGTGVYGVTLGAGIYGVYGTSGAAGGAGVRGDCTGGTGVLGSVSDGYGVLGQANTGNGVRGFSNQNHAVVGQTAQPYFGGVFGAATIANTVGIYGSTVNGSSGNVASAYAGYMDGNFVAVHGVKSAAVPTGKGEYGLVYCMESPECWFEDFGEAKLVKGITTVTIDPAFAAIVHTDSYHVFLTPGGDCKGLSVVNKTAGGFVVRELQGGASSLTFSYRIVAKRKDVVAGRLAKFDLPGKAKHDVTPPHIPAPPLPQRP
ncbi:MAG: hypothetical protein ACYDAR_21675 [Thermomicrobiales bacterium]